MDMTANIVSPGRRAARLAAACCAWLLGTAPGCGGGGDGAGATGGASQTGGTGTATGAGTGSGSGGATGAGTAGTGAGTGSTGSTGSTGGSGGSTGGGVVGPTLAFDWARSLWTTSRNDVPLGAVVTPEALYVAGIRAKDLDLLVTTIDNGSQQFRLAKLDPATGDPLAIQTGSCSGFINLADVSHARDVTADAAGNVYVAGHARCSTFKIGYMGQEWTQSTELAGDALVIGFKPTLEPLWIASLQSDAEDKAEAIVASGDRLFVAGHFSGTTLAVGGVDTLSNRGGFDVFLATYTTGGSATGDVVGIGGGEDDGQPGVAVADAGDVYVTGYVRSADAAVYTKDGVVMALGAPSGGSDVFVAKFSPTLDLQWVQRFGGPGDDKGRSLAARGSRVYVGGFAEDTMTLPGCCDVANAGGRDGFVVYMDLAGQFLRGVDVGSDGTDLVTSVRAAPSAGRLYVQGFISGETILDGQTLSAAGRDPFVVELDDAGVAQFAMSATGPEGDESTAMAVSTDALFVTGFYASDPLMFGGTPVALGGDPADAYVARFTVDP